MSLSKLPRLRKMYIALKKYRFAKIVCRKAKLRTLSQTITYAIKRKFNDYLAKMDASLKQNPIFLELPRYIKPKCTIVPLLYPTMSYSNKKGTSPADKAARTVQLVLLLGFLLWAELKPVVPMGFLVVSLRNVVNR